jgi:VCBS repeat-containing protein
VNADGATDAVVVKTSGTVELWLNAHDTTPTLALAQTLATATGTRVWLNTAAVFIDSLQTIGSASALDVALGDVNRDGALDILVAQGASGSSLWLNSSSATFTVAPTAFSSQPAHRASLLDADNDGLLDAILARDDATTAAFFAHAPAAFFHTAVNLGGGGASSAFATGDTDGDGSLDFIGSDATGAFGAWTHQSNGTYARTATQPTFVAGSSPVLADLDGDGALDLVRIDAATGLPAVSLYRVTPTRGDEDTAITLTAAGFTRDGGAAITHVRIESLPASGTLAGASVNDTFTLAQAAALVFTSSANVHGLSSFTFSASTDGGATYSATPSTHWLLLANTPDAVAPVADAYSVDQGALLTVATSLLANDVNNDAASLVSLPAHGALTLNADGTFTYQHNNSETRTDTFVYRATNLTTLSSDTATVTITVANVNAAPTGATLARDAAVLYTGQPAGQIVGTLAGLDADPEDAGTHTFALVPGTGDTHNAAFILDGNVLKTAATLDFADGLARSVRVSVTDASLTTAEQVITFSTVQEPTLAPATYETLEDIPLTLDIVAQGGASTLTYTILTPPAHGTLTGTAPALTYSPNPLFHGTDTFVARVSDGTLTTADVTFTLTVVHVNHAPTASALALTTTEDTDGVLALAATDIDGDTPLTFTIVQAPTRGTLAIDGTSVTYTPFANAHGADSFLYTASDGQLDSAPALASIAITPVNDFPTLPAGPFALEVKKFQYVTFTVAGTDIESPANIRYRVGTAPSHGTLFIYGTSVTYEPTRGYVGSDTFTIIATDNEDADTAPATYDVTVFNPLPVATDSVVALDQRTSATFSLIGSDPEGERIDFVITTPPAHGTLDSFGNGHTYTPDIAFSGADTLTFVVTDADGTSAPATVTLNVTHVNVAPVASDIAITQDGLAPTATFTLSATDTADDIATLTYRIVTPPVHGTLSGTAPDLTYTANTTPFEGTDTFTYVANDGETDSAPATVTLTFTKTIGQPAGTFDFLTVYRGLYESVNVLANDYDAWGEPLHIMSYTQGAHGTVSGGSGALYYEHLGNTAGTDTFTYTVSNGHETRVVDVHVTIASRTINLTTSADSGPGSLRDALALVKRFAQFPVNELDENGDRINDGRRASWTFRLFDLEDPIELSTVGETDPLLGDTALVIDGHVKILGAPSATISRSPAALELRLFRVLPASSLTLEYVTLADGVANLGGAIHNAGPLTLKNVTLDGNTAQADANTAGLYQAGGTTTAARATFSGHGDAKDFRNTGGATFIAGDLTVESPTAPWIDPVADITASTRLSRAFSTLLTSGQSISVVRPYDIPVYSVSGTSATTRTLANLFDSNTPQGEHLITLVASGDGATFKREVGVTVDYYSNQLPIARDDTIAVQPYGTVALTALALLNDEDPDGTPLYNIFLQSSPSSGYITYVQGQPVFQAYGDDTSVTYNLGSGNTATIHFTIQTTTPDVVNTADSGEESLRERIELANAFPNQAWTLHAVDLGEPLLVASTVGDSDATRGDSAFLIAGDVTIDGSDTPDLVLRRSADAPAMRLFRVAPGAKLTLRNLTVEGGLAALGGAIYNEGTVILDGATLQAHRATATGATTAGLGGALYNAGGTVTATDSALTGNFADSASDTVFGLGGALYTRNGTVTLAGTTLTANTAGHGGGLYAEGDAGHADVTLATSAFSNADAGSDLSAITRNGGTVAFHNEESVIPRVNGPWVGNVGAAEMHFTDSTPQSIGFTTNAAVPDLVLSATSSSQAIIADSDLVITGEGSFRTLSAVANLSGPVVIRLIATSAGVSFDEPFALAAYTPLFSTPNAFPQVAEIYGLETALINPINGIAPATDPLGLPLTIVSVTTPAHGTAVIVENGKKIRYTHTDAANLTTSDEFFYTLSNGFGGTASSGVHIELLTAGSTVSSLSQLTAAIAAAAAHPLIPWPITIAASAAGQTWSLNTYRSDAGTQYSAYRISGHVVIDGTAAPGFTLYAPPGGMSGPPIRHFLVPVGARLDLVNLTLSGGNAYGFPDAAIGGAIANFGTFTADHVTFVNNRSYSGPILGGALYNDGGSVSLFDTAFTTNGNASATGGAIYSRNGSLTLDGVTFSGNTASTAANLYLVGDAANATISTTGTTIGSRVFTTINGGTLTLVGFPSAIADTVTYPAGRTLILNLETLLANDTGGPFASVTLDLTGTLGTIDREGDGLLYTPPLDFTEDDTFNYTVTTATGFTSTATVTIQTRTVLTTAPRTGGGVTFQFTGLPYQEYIVQVSTDLIHWTTLTTVTTDEDGAVTTEDATPPAQGAARFYRTVRNNN